MEEEDGGCSSISRRACSKDRTLLPLFFLMRRDAAKMFAGGGGKRNRGFAFLTGPCVSVSDPPFDKVSALLVLSLRKSADDCERVLVRFCPLERGGF